MDWAVDTTDHSLQAMHSHIHRCRLEILQQLEMWANAQRDGRPAEYRWHPV